MSKVNAYKCDICNGLKEGYPRYCVSKTYIQWWEKLTGKGHICPDCYKKFLKFAEAERNKEVGNGIN